MIKIEKGIIMMKIPTIKAIILLDNLKMKNPAEKVFIIMAETAQIQDIGFLSILFSWLSGDIKSQFLTLN